MKRILVLAVSCAAVFALAACSSSEPTGTTDSSVDVPSTTPSSPTSPAALVIGDCTIEPATSCPDAQLRLASLHSVDLHGANLAGADLYGADLRHVDLRDADLSEANIQKADLTGAHLDRANLSGAQLAYANLTNTNLTKATVTNGQLKKALLCQTKMPDGSVNKTGCADSVDTTTPTPGPTKSPKPESKAPKIDKFNITPSPVVCHSKSEEKSVKVRFSVSDASAVQFQIDSEAPGGEFDPATTKTAHLAFDCGDSEHQYTIIALGSGSKKVTDDLTIKRQLDKTAPN